jgi:hypothetical protein
MDPAATVASGFQGGWLAHHDQRKCRGMADRSLRVSESSGVLRRPTAPAPLLISVADVASTHPVAIRVAPVGRASRSGEPVPPFPQSWREFRS